MIGPRNLTLGEELYLEIDDNHYLERLYQKILFSYGNKLFGETHYKNLSNKELLDSLRFADILSKSTDIVKSGKHKVWAQEIMSLLYELYPDNEKVIIYLHSVLSNCTNYYALEQKRLPIKGLGFLRI
jgi:hypothetical protein